MIKVKDLKKIYGSGEGEVTALNRVSLSIEEGEFVAIMGPSGCGKSTFLHLLGGLQKPTSGEIELRGRSLSKLNDDEITLVRRKEIGFIFQFFNLIPILNAVENVSMPLILDGMKPKEANIKAKKWLEKVGLGNRTKHLPNQLSGGQQQRVAIARALVHDPTFILADEPTGNLDTRSAEEIAGLLREVCGKWGKTIVMVTHDPRMSSYANRIVHLKDGAIISENRLV